jgi:hypothetical protein
LHLAESFGIISCTIPDAVAILRVQEHLDNNYLEATAEQLGVKAILDELRQIAESYDPHVIL